ncbi:MAG: glycosyltransferase [Planctomycetes bacterium]|nr:glycosyltransferase [Planctomycetota bacterium]
MVSADDLPPGGRARRMARVLAAAGHMVTVHGVLAEGAEPEEDDGPVVLVRAALGRFEPPKAGLRGLLSGGDHFQRCEPVVRLAITRDPPECLHAFGLDVAGPALTAATGLGVPLVFDDVAGGPDDGWESAEPTGGARLRESVRRLRASAVAVEKKVRRGAAGQVASSDALADDVRARFRCECPVVVRDCPPLRRVDAGDALRARLGTRPSDRIVVFHGPPDAAHGVESAIRAIRVLGDHVILAILGAAWCQDRLLRLAADEGVLAQVRVVSVTKRDDVLRLIASAEVAVLPLSPAVRATRLGLPAALSECLMAGTPLVVSDVPEAGGLVRRLAAGIVVPVAAGARDVHPNDVAGGLRTLLADPDLREACRAAALRGAADELHWEKEAGRLVDLYDRISSAL